jgi:hypothetical protein
MNSPQLFDQKPRVDTVDGLHVLVADLRALAERLELKERSHALRPTLEALGQRLSGPRAVVMLLSDSEELKRRFLERLLGPKLAQVPRPTTTCIRLEYAPVAGCAADMPRANGMELIRLPNPTLKSGLAVIDTPVASGEPDASLLEYAEQADVWILVLDADHTLSKASQSLLRRFPDAGARLEIVIENAEALSGDERLATRERLVTTLREQCGIEAPRLTLVASAATGGDDAGYWQGRFATFHSVMMLRGREHWLAGTRTMVADALSGVSAEIEFALKDLAIGPRHARLRLGMKDLDALRTLFQELNSLNRESAREAGAAPVRPEMQAAEAGGQTRGDAGAAKAAMMPPGLVSPDEPLAARNGTAGLAEFFRGATLDLPTLDLPTPDLRRGLRRATMMPVAGAALAIAIACLVVGTLSTRGFFLGHEPGAAWDYHATQPAPVKRVAAGSKPEVDLPQPGTFGALPETTSPSTEDLPVTPPVKRRGRVRLPLAKPIPSGATAGVISPAKRHHRHLLGLGKLWHWVRHSRSDAKTE